MILKSEIIDAWFKSMEQPPTKQQCNEFMANFGISRTYMYDRLSKYYIRIKEAVNVKQAEKNMRISKDFEKDIQHFTYDIESDIKHVNVDELYKQATI